MRKTFTTAELTSRLSRPAFRAIEVVARQLGVAVPASAPVEASRQQSIATDEASTTDVVRSNETASIGAPPLSKSSASSETSSATPVVTSMRTEGTSPHPSRRPVAASVVTRTDGLAIEPGTSPLSASPPRQPDRDGDSARTGASADSPVRAGNVSHSHDSTGRTPAASTGPRVMQERARATEPLAPSSPAQSPEPVVSQTTSREPVGPHSPSPHRPIGGTNTFSPRAEPHEARTGVTSGDSLPHHAADPAPSSIPSGLSISIKATPPRPPDRQVVRLLRPLTPPAEGVPAAMPQPARSESTSLAQPLAAPVPRHEVTSEAPARSAAERLESPLPAPPHASVPAAASRPATIPTASGSNTISHQPAAWPEPLQDSHAAGSPNPLAPSARPEAPRENTSSPRPVVRLLSPTATPAASRAPVTGARPKTRLHFAPPSDTSPPPPSPTAQLAQQVTQELAPLMNRAEQLTRQAQPSETSSRAPANESAGVRNTFNVNVQVGSDSAAPGLDRRTLEDALVDILRETARRHGMEV